MNIIRDGERTGLVDKNIKGVELDGISDATILARNLGELASKDLTGTVAELDKCFALEALRIQTTLIAEIIKREESDTPFCFIAVDAPLDELPKFVKNNPFYHKEGMAGRILEQAANIGST